MIIFTGKVQQSNYTCQMVSVLSIKELLISATVGLHIACLLEPGACVYWTIGYSSSVVLSTSVLKCLAQMRADCQAPLYGFSMTVV